MFNVYIDNNTFPNGLKKADIKRAYKKDDPFDKLNYRPIIDPLFYLKHLNAAYMIIIVILL